LKKVIADFKYFYIFDSMTYVELSIFIPIKEI
jgi:hypothetical protein